MKRVLAAALLLAACQTSHGPSTRSFVYNQTTAAFRLDGETVKATFSGTVYTGNGATDTVTLERGSLRWNLITTSLLPAADPNDYDAAINVHEDVADSLYCREYSPYVQAEISKP